VEETLASGVSVATVARAHGVNANQVFHWRKLYQAGLLESSVLPASDASTPGMRMLPVTVAEDLRCDVPLTAATFMQSQHGATRKAFGLDSSGVIELTLPKGQVRFSGRVDADALRVVLECLLV
jgi:transposase